MSASQAAGRIRSDLRRRLLERVFARGPLYASGERTGELTNTVVEGVESLDAYYSQYLPSLALSVLVPVTILLFVFPIDFLSGVVFLLTAPLIPLFMILIGKAADALTRRQWESMSRMNAHFLDVLQGLTTLKLFNRSRAQSETIGRITARFRDTTLGVLRVAFLSALVLELTASISTAIVAVEVGLRLVYSNIGFEQAFFVLVLAPEFYQPLRTLGASFHAGMSGVAAARRIREVLETNEWESGRGGEWGISRGVLHAPALRITHSPTLPLPHSRLKFDSVSLSYDGERQALKGVSFEVRAGEMVALVGPSGAGKSSIASLLLGFAEPDGGEILVDGLPLSQMPVEEWRKMVAWVPQSPYLFSGTVADNIRLGRPEASLEEVERAAARADADEFIRNLPGGYGAQVGERAVRLSGGQAQRIALARAYLKDAPIVILDEPTSHLDPETGARVQEGFERLAEGRTALVIAHQLSTVRRADRILVLDEGSVVESGTHEGLLARGGFYAHMVAASLGHGEGKEWKGTALTPVLSSPADPTAIFPISHSPPHPLSHSSHSSLTPGRP